MAIKVLHQGLATSVQDLGRPGYFHLGIPLGGAMDRLALKAANLLVGNDEGAAGLEAVFIGFLGSAIGVGVAMIVGTGVSSVLAKGLFSDLPGLQLIAFDPVSIAVIILVVMAIAFLAGTLRAARAAKADPVESLRYE